jgi:AcrR family transcriptional regulator
MTAVATRDAATTKERILEAAFEEFTQRGFAGGRVDDIAARADVNKALLYHYYEDKNALFRAVLERKMAMLAELRVDPTRFAECAGEFFDLYAANPWLSRLMQWEALDFGTRRVPSEAARRAQLGLRIDEIARAQSAGIIDPALDPGQTLVTLIALVSSWFTCPQTARMVTGGNPYSNEALRKRRAHVIDVARRILEVRR